MAHLPPGCRGLWAGFFLMNPQGPRVWLVPICMSPKSRGLNYITLLTGSLQQGQEEARGVLIPHYISLLFLGFSSKFPFSLRRRVLLSPLFFSITKSQKILFVYEKGTPSMPFKGPSLKLDSVASLGNILMEISILMSCRKKKITLA